MGELALLVSDYKRQAERFGLCPMSREAICALMNDPLSSNDERSRTAVVKEPEVAGA